MRTQSANEKTKIKKKKIQQQRWNEMKQLHNKSPFIALHNINCVVRCLWRFSVLEMMPYSTSKWLDLSIAAKRNGHYNAQTFTIEP